MTGWNGRRVLVTGGEGFIGSHLVEELVAEGANVRALVHYNPFGKWGWLHERASDVEILAGDVRDAERVARVADGVEVIFHLAALVGIPYSYEAPESYVQTNVVGTYNLLSAARRAGVTRYVQTSTSEVYGSALRVPIDEHHPLQPQSPYSASKIAADMLALSFHHSFELPVAVVRPFNTYGPRQSARAVIPAVLGQIYAGVVGDPGRCDEPRSGTSTSSPTRRRGFWPWRECDRALGEVVNVGSGREIAIGDLIDLMIEVSGRDVRAVRAPERIRPAASEVDRLMCDNRRALEWAGWRPEVSLEDGLRRTADWIAENLSSVQSRRYQV